MSPTLTLRPPMGAAIFRLAILVAVVGVALGHAVPPSAQREAPAPRLYVLDCGRLEGRNLERYNLPNEERAMSVSCILVVHSRGTLLWETGLGDQFAGGQETPVDPGWRVAHTLRGQLAEIGYEPADITYLAISHMHGDHTGNANDYAGATWLVQAAEREVAFADGRNTTPYEALRNSTTVTLTGDHDVFADGTVVIKSTPGHTPGHQSLFVGLAAAGPVVLSGDLYHYPEERSLDRVPTFEFDPDQTLASRAALEEFMRETGAQLWIQHDIVADADLKNSPEFYD